jgi:hypothetical protein
MLGLCPNHPKPSCRMLLWYMQPGAQDPTSNPTVAARGYRGNQETEWPELSPCSKPQVGWVGHGSWSWWKRVKGCILQLHFRRMEQSFHHIIHIFIRVACGSDWSLSSLFLCIVFGASKSNGGGSRKKVPNFSCQRKSRMGIVGGAGLQ